MTILTASHREGVAEEGVKHGLFTEIILDGLRGGAADILGNVTPAALYSLVDQTLGPWGQRPVYKANVQTFGALRQVDPKIPKDYRVNLRAFDAVMNLAKSRGGLGGGTLIVAASGDESRGTDHPDWRIAASLPAAV